MSTPKEISKENELLVFIINRKIGNLARERAKAEGRSLSNFLAFTVSKAIQGEQYHA